MVIIVSSRIMATSIDLNIVQGSDFNVSIVAVDDLGTVINLTDYTVAGYAKHRYGDDEPTFDFKPTVSNATAGEISMSLTPTETASIPVGQFVYGIECLSGDSIGFKVMNGKVNVTPEVNK